MDGNHSHNDQNGSLEQKISYQFLGKTKTETNKEIFAAKILDLVYNIPESSEATQSQTYLSD